MGNTNNNNGNRRVVSKNTHSLWQRRRRAANLPPFSHSTISFRMYPHKRKILVRGTKQYNFHCIDKSVIYIYICNVRVWIFFLGLLTHVPFPSFWSASLFSIFRHCDRQTFLLQTLLLLFMVLCANWENKRIRECDSIRLCRLFTHSLPRGKWKCNVDLLLLFFGLSCVSFVVCLVVFTFTFFLLTWLAMNTLENIITYKT